jgi:transcriptional regulator with XRE-family HTH domain
MDPEVSFGRWVKERRKALDLTQHTFAEQMSCAVSTIQKIETDARRPSRHLAELLAARLQILPDERDAFLRLARHCPPRHRNRDTRLDSLQRET